MTDAIELDFKIGEICFLFDTYYDSSMIPKLVKITGFKQHNGTLYYICTSETDFNFLAHPSNLQHIQQG